MPKDLNILKKSFLSDLDGAKDANSLESLRVKYLGRKSALNSTFGSLKNMPIAKRRIVAREAQVLKRKIEDELKKKSSVISHDSPAVPRVDLSAPGRKPERGHLHPLTIIDREIRDIFLSMGFSVVEGPEIETEYYNFDALNIPPDHPARDVWDTFWLRSNQKIRNPKSEIRNGQKLLLRTHTSPVQIRYMEEHNPPFQIIVPGRVFRYEATDASHEVNFYQLEGLMIGKTVSLANFKFVVEEFFKRFFRGQKIDFRYRPSYFPFVEPGLEVDIKLETSDKKQGARWFEVMGAGMVHPHVFEYARHNPRDWQGFAFGMGIDRLAMIKYKIPDIRMFYSGDLRVIKQF